MIGYESKLKRADPQNENGKVGGLTKAMINRIELSAKMFRRRHWYNAYKYLQGIAKIYPNTFEHWKYGFQP